MTSRYSRATALLLSVLQPFQPTPNKDNGYDVADYYGVDPRHGSLGDFVDFAHQAKQRGLKIPITEIYNPNGPSIKDAVVTVGFEAGYGTGEFVSSEGLVLTNHHVAFDGLVAASDTSKDYGTNGYIAHNRTEELPFRGYTISITRDLKDVTSEVLGGVTDSMSAADRNAAISQSRQ